MTPRLSAITDRIVSASATIIGTFEVRVDDRPMHSWKEVADSLHIPLTFKGSRSTTFRHGLVVPVGLPIHLIELPDTNDIRLFRSRLDHMSTYVCFCSLYGDCWELHADITEPLPVKACVDDTRRAFRQ